METFERTLGTDKRVWYRLAAWFFSAVVVVKAGLEILPDWRHNMRGWEAYWIAQSVVAGKGYSFPSGHRWLSDVVDGNPFLRIGDGGFQLTAWADPIYTFCLAGFIWLFGDYHQLAAAVFNLVLLLAVLGLTYHLCERLVSAPAGLMAVVVLGGIGPSGNWGLGREGIADAIPRMLNTLTSAILVVLSALMLMKFLERPSNRHAGLLGLVLGLTALGCPTAQLFIPVTVAAVAVWGRKNLRPAVTHAVLILVAAVFVVMPWTVRNYMTFGKFVPVRTGFGQNAFIGVVGSAGTVAPEKLRSHVKPPWRAETPRDAVRKIIQYPHDDLADLERFQLDYAREVGGAEYAGMNEAQRDSWFLQEAKTFIAANPVMSAQLAIANIEAFARLIEGSVGMLVCLLAALGGLFAIRKPVVLILALWVGTYAAPYLLVSCYYGRYRAPIDPLLVMLAAFAVCQVLEIGSDKLGIEFRTPWRFR